VTPFGLRAETRDGVCVLAGGFCRAGWGGTLERRLAEELSGAVFAPCRDPFLTDVKLHRVLTDAATRCRAELDAGGAVLLAAAAPGGEELSGAVMGRLDSEMTSAEGELEAVGNGLYCACFPGAFGAAFIARDTPDAQRRYRRLRRADAEQAVEELRDTSFLLVFDSKIGCAGELTLGNGTRMRRLILPIGTP